MTNDKKPPDDEGPADKLLTGDIAGFAAAMQRHARGPAGANLRLAHLREQVAIRIFGGDFDKARRLLDLPNAALGGLSIKEAAATHESMLEAKELIAKLEISGFSEGLLVFAESIRSQWQQESELLLELLPAAWGMDDSEFEQLLEVPPDWLRAWRNHEVHIGPDVHRRIRRLRKLHDAFRLVFPPQRHAMAWRRRWRDDSPIGDESPWSAFIKDGDAALDKIEAHLRAQC